MTDEERREYRRLTSQRYREANREKVRLYNQAYRAANRKKLRAQERAWREANRDRVRSYTDPEKNRLRVRQWNEANPEKARLRTEQWKKENPERQRTLILRATRTRRARLLGAEGSHTQQQLDDRFSYYGHKCAYCGAEGELEMEHVIPLSRGGTNWPSNLRPSCVSCNRQKGSRTLSEWRAA